jgi:hypothetical protein
MVPAFADTITLPSPHRHQICCAPICRQRWQLELKRQSQTSEIAHHPPLTKNISCSL